MTTSVLGKSTLHEAIMASSSSVRDSLPKEYHKHFETLRQEIIDFAQAHDIPRESLAKPDALREAASKLSIPDLQQLAILLEHFEHLLVKKEPWKNEEAIEYAQEFYHLREQYDFQVNFLVEAGILKEGVIMGIDGNKYPIPTLEQIATRLFERREELKTKHDQGFTKLLLVPFGMSLDVLIETLKQFLLSYKQKNSTFDLNTNEPLWTWPEYQGADIGDSPKLVYYPQSFTKEDHGGKTKMEVLEGQARGRWALPPTAGSATGGTTSVGVAGESETRTSGWTIHLFQPSDPSNPDSKGFAPIPRQGQGTPQGDLTPRPPFRERGDRSPLEAGQSPNEYLSLLQEAQDDENSPYHNESGMTPEDWIIAFMTHLKETEQPLGGDVYLVGTFSRSIAGVPYMFWDFGNLQACLGRDIKPHGRAKYIGARSSVIV